METLFQISKNSTVNGHIPSIPTQSQKQRQQQVLYQQYLQARKKK